MVSRPRCLGWILAALALLGVAACNFSLQDYPYCFACASGSDCPLGTRCGAGFCRYPCLADGGCPVSNAGCGKDGFCHATDDGGC